MPGQQPNRSRFAAHRSQRHSTAALPIDAVGSAIARTQQWLLARQDPDGHWVGELEGDSILQSEYILLLAWLESNGAAPAWASERIQRAARQLVVQQQPGGGWSLFPGGPLEISASVKAYYALKLVGNAPNAPHMVRAREAILARVRDRVALHQHVPVRAVDVNSVGPRPAAARPLRLR